MSLYNEERSVGYAMQSILAQTYTDFEFLIIDDGSTDGSKTVVDSFDDSRIRLVSRPNKGLTPSLNEGIELARGAYIARQDADDVSMPTRLEREVAVLDRRPDIGLVGTNYTIVDEEGAHLTTTSVFTHPDDLAVAEIVSNQFGHGSVMMRKALVRELGGYDPGAGDIVGDYDLWLRIGRVAKIANIEEPLYQWRRSGGSLSMADRQLAIDQTFALRDREFPRLLVKGSAFRIVRSFHPAGFYPSRREYFRKKATLFRSLAYLYRREGRPWTAIAMQAAAVLYEPKERRNLLYLVMVIRDRTRRQLWDFEFV
jgi:glycosyltransferase involved in cell wall biosynthesis